MNWFQNLEPHPMENRPARFLEWASDEDPMHDVVTPKARGHTVDFMHRLLNYTDAYWRRQEYLERKARGEAVEERE